MDKKIMAVAAALVILVSAGAVSIMLLNNDNETAKGSVSGQALVYGNVNNDEVIDNSDLNELQNIVESGKWDFKNQPFADVNCDKKVDQSDVDALKKIINKEKTIIYYTGTNGSVCSLHYPVTGNIAVSSDYGLMMTQVLGCYDRITHASQDRVIDKLDEFRYPGCKSFKSLGNYTSDNYTGFVENLITSGCSVLLGQCTPAVYNLIQESGKEVDLILLSTSAEIQQNGMDIVQSILTAGVLLDCTGNSKEYADYCTSLTAYIAEHAMVNQVVTFVDAYNTNNAVTTTVHTTKGDNGSMTGVIWSLSFLPMVSEVEWNKLDTNGRSLNIEIEEIIKLNPDIIIVSGWGKVATNATVAEAQVAYDKLASYFSGTNAYKNGKIYGIAYEVYGTYIGVGGLALLASYIWPGSFSEDEGWEKLQYVIDNFTMMKGTDVKTLGGVQPIKCNCP